MEVTPQSAHILSMQKYLCSRLTTEAESWQELMCLQHDVIETAFCTLYRHSLIVVDI